MPQDAEAACHVLRRSITECCAKDHHDEPAILEAWLKNKTPENVRTWFERAGSFPIIAELEGAIVGVALMSAKGEVALCYLVPEARFVGAGKALLSAIEVEAVRRGLDSLHLESTLTARPFYLRNGFEALGEPAVAFGVTAFPMQKRLAMVQNGRNDG
jgi:GNAT superfamily N-acetyltransferase